MTSRTAAHSLIRKAVDERALKRAARQCMGRTGSPGADGMTWKTFRRDMPARIAALSTALADGTWQPGPLRTEEFDAWGKHHTITIPTVTDRIVHRALRNAIEPVLERDAYPPWMFGWHRRAGRPLAVAAAARHLAAGLTWVADIDVAAATRGVALEDAVTSVARFVHDGSVLALLRRILDALPDPLAPGSGLSPMLTNLRMTPVDQQMAGQTAVRMTDNYTLFTPTEPEAELAYQHLAGLLAQHGMAPAPAKSKIWRPNPEDLYAAG
ncbi:reverse transcriptase domain-containing protein [Streptomyces sp. NBC_00439]|uniref:reverse transcriptase domain-containing protein n=1 Tax=Streptomyces sp. NBC_00439 TaxID=2903650 RepID=UPI00225ADD80|nr:reverse transcriptase domain-containing protein [Streptomyces sp. NBC_00439]MCX5103647.1 reverse transcriptase domain-containing protein [Streptomyces sp. NBC_00439]